MGGILLLCGFLTCGIVLADALARRACGLIRLWLGLCAGLALMMWTPTVFAFFTTFNVLAQALGLGASALLAGAAAWRNRRVSRAGGPFCGEIPPALVLALAVPMTALSGYLQFTHILREADGALYVGQSTYGDLCLHLGIATSLRNAAYPPDYSILKGTLLGYPFLSDSMVTSMLLFGGGLAASFRVTGTLMMALVYVGFIIFAWELTRKRAAVAVAFLLTFVNGGLGFLYVLDGAMRDPTMLREVFTGFYKTPTNMPDLNLRWVNVICDMMIPQRTLLAGWMMLLPALWLLVRAIRTRRTALFAILGVWAGLMPMVHTHSFLGLGLISAGAMLTVALFRRGDERGSLLRGFLAYGFIAVALALPQLMEWTFPQTVGGGSMKLRFNWVNNQNGLIDGYFWFWIKNVGPIYLMMAPAALSMRKGGTGRMLAVGALCVYAVAETIQFQPNEYDNNKLFYVAFIAMTPMVGRYLVRLWDALKGVRGRAVLAAAFLIVCLLSGTLTLGREAVSDYRLFSADEAAAAQFVEENTPEKAMFLTGTQHNNPIAALTGRYIVCGTGSYLYFHGVDYAQNQADVGRMMEQPAENAALFEKYGVDYIYLSSYERSNYDVDEEWFRENATAVYEGFEVTIYAMNAQ